MDEYAGGQKYEILIRAGEDYIAAATELDREVNRWLADGWQLHGPTQMAVVGGEVVFMQVVILTASGM